MRRKVLGVSQDMLAEALKLTFQQIQKYERGANRISASKLYEIATALQTPVEFFFEGLAAPADEGEASAQAAQRVIIAFLNSPEGLELATLFPKIGQAKTRRHVLDLVRAVANDQ